MSPSLREAPGSDGGCSDSPLYNVEHKGSDTSLKGPKDPLRISPPSSIATQGLWRRHLNLVPAVVA